MRRGQLFDMALQGPLVGNDNRVLMEAVRAGTGVGLGFEPEVQADFATGRLQPLLQSYWARFPGFYLYHPSRLQMPRKLRAFIDFLTPRLNAKAARSAVG